jgi:hypothetical protein
MQYVRVAQRGLELVHQHEERQESCVRPREELAAIAAGDLRKVRVCAVMVPSSSECLKELERSLFVMNEPCPFDVPIITSSIQIISLSKRIANNP